LLKICINSTFSARINDCTLTRTKNLNINEDTKKRIYKILEDPRTSDLKEISAEELDQVQNVFSFGRCEYFLKQTGLIQKLPQQRKKELEQFIDSRKINSFKIFSEFIKVAQALNSKKIIFIPLKGLHLNLEIYKNLSLRNIRDIDLLIKKESLTSYLECLFSIGYKFKNSDIQPKDFKYSDYHYDIPVLINENGIHVETHLKIIDAKFNQLIFEKSYKKKYSDTLYLDFMSNENLIIHLIYHGTIKNGFDNGLVSIIDVMNILKSNKINLAFLLDSADSLGLKKNICYFLSIINFRFDGIKIDQKFLIKKDSLNLLNYEDLILMNYADAFSFRLFNKRRKYDAFSYQAFLSESGRSKISLSDFFGRIFRITFSFLKTIFSIFINKSYRVDVKRVKEITNYLKDK
tara:strand:+ start:154 stop:1368 length:1215 start_codon:yes stop_codon:yes gene_type:complete